jgi:hypothetical protein
MKPSMVRSFSTTFALAAALLAGAVAAPRANADSALLTRGGSLYEVFPTSYGQVIKTTDESAARTPVLALRTTTPDGDSRVEIVEGTFDTRVETSESIEFDETTQTLFVVYTQFQGLMSDLHFAVRRDGKWIEKWIAPNVGLYLSLNPRLVVTRQHYVDFDGNGGTVAKSRSILSLIWWEESGVSQARYAALFVEDGALDLDNPVVVNLNDLAGASGTTDAHGLPISSYQFPAIQRDPTTNGGVLVSFANLVSSRHEVFRVTFPDDLTKLSGGEGKQFARGRVPIGGRVNNGSIPGKIDTTSTVSTVLSPSGVPTFYWEESSGSGRLFRYVRGDDPDGGILSLSLRDDFNGDRARLLLRDMTEKQ